MIIFSPGTVMWLRLGQMQFECMDQDTDSVQNLKLNQ